MTTQSSSDIADAAMVIRPILVVDDSRGQRRLVSRALAKWGYDTIEAASGEQALAIAAASEIDVVISDWMMPGMSGVEFCRAFRQQVGERPAYFILLTAQTEREVLAEGLESGADDFLSKPFNAVELRARLRAGERMVNAQRALSGKNDALSSAMEELSNAYSAIERDLKGAQKFQEGLVPERHIGIGSIDVTMLFRPCGHVGGDIVGYFRVNDTELGIYAVDVSGHGVASALMTARIASFLNDATPDRNIALEPTATGYAMIALPEVCAKLNSVLQSDAESDQYLTMSIARVNTETGAVALCQAGHPSPVVQRADGCVAFHELFSTPLGLIDEGEYACMNLTLAVGDRLMMYSDGITECNNLAGHLLDDDGLERIIRQQKDLRGRAFVDSLVVALLEFNGHQDFPDDLSAVLIERRQSPK